jgi:peptide deformylase
VTPLDLEAWLAASGSRPPIVQAGARVLRRPSMDVSPSLFGTATLLQLVTLMIDTMRAAPGVGLAAPQIGVPLRLFVAEDPEERLAHVASEARAIRRREPLPLMAVVNPRVTSVSEGVETFFEGCLSVRGYGALVQRAAAVAVTGVDLNGLAVSHRFEGWSARIMQHEMDHLDGTLYVDRMITRSLAGEADLARLSGLPVGEVLAEIEQR